MTTPEPTLIPETPKAEFKDTPANIQYVQCGILLAGGLTASLCYSLANQNLLFYAAAGVAVVSAIIGAVIVQKLPGNKTYLQHFEERLVLADGDKIIEIPFDQLQGFSASWTNIHVNGIYSTSTVRFSFDVAGSFRVYQYDAAASRGTLKYEQLQALQGDVSTVVANRLRETLLAESFVPWTAQLTITTAGIDYRQHGTGEARLIPFAQLGKWEVDDGIFKLALANERRPSITEPISQTNFYPGLLLFGELYEEFSQRDDIPAAKSQPSQLSDCLPV